RGRAAVAGASQGAEGGLPGAYGKAVGRASCALGGAFSGGERPPGLGFGIALWARGKHRPPPRRGSSGRPVARNRSGSIQLPPALRSRVRARRAASLAAMGRARTAMQPYRSTGGDSGVVAYACGPGWIDIRFRRGGTYRYDGRHPGALHVMQMQRLAEAGDGLNTYLNRYVRDDYAARLD